MWPETGRPTNRGSPQALTGIRSRTREPARSGKKMPQPRTVGVRVLVVGQHPAPSDY